MPGSLVRFELLSQADDLEASFAKVRRRGGTAADRHPIPGVDWFAQGRETEGNDLSLSVSDASVAA